MEKPELIEYEQELNQIAVTIDWHSVGIVGVTTEKDCDRSFLLGSGTVVRAGNNIGVLTAYHVTDLSRNIKKMGFVIKDYAHNLTIPKEYLNIVALAKPVNSTQGPDLSFILLPENILSEIVSTKIVYDLETAKTRYSEMDIYDNYAWMVHGYPDELSKKEGPHGSFYNVNVHYSMWYACLSIHQSDKGTGELIDLVVPYIPERSTINSFGGISGGGLWSIPIVKEGDEISSFGKPFLSGVAFCEMIGSEEIEFIRCNGPKELHTKYYRIIEQHCV